MKIWTCKIGETTQPINGADAPMRQAVAIAYKQLTGEEPAFLFSGWGDSLTESERAVVENRLPVRQATAPATAPDELERLKAESEERLQNAAALVTENEQLRWAIKDALAQLQRGDFADAESTLSVTAMKETP